MARKMIKKVNNNSSDIKALYDEFILEKSLDCRPKTLEGYKYKVLPFVKWLSENNKEVTQATTNEYILKMKEYYSNPTTVNTNLRAIKTFVLWLNKKGKCESIHIKVKKDIIQVKNLYTNKEIEAMVKSPSKDCTWTELRDWAIVNTLVATGMRISSLTNIKIEDVDFENDVITLTHTKNGKGQIIPLSLALKKVILEYLNSWDNTKENYLFPNVYGERFKSVHSITKLVERYNKKRGVTKTSAHLIRHTFAHNYIMKNGDIFRLQKLLGHSDIEVTRIYANISIDDLKKDFNAMNLLDNSYKNKIQLNR